jgi:hypothetical protein
MWKLKKEFRSTISQKKKNRQRKIEKLVHEDSRVKKIKEEHAQK